MPAPIAAARTPGEAGRRLLVVRADAAPAHLSLDALPGLLGPGDLVVLNDADTLPSALVGTLPDGRRVELRLAQRVSGAVFVAAVLGDGTWRDPTERRGPPPDLRPGDAVDLGGGAVAHVLAADEPHLARIELLHPRGWLAALHAAGGPIRYSYLSEEAPLRAFRTRFAARPWSMESPSAGLPLRWEHLLALRRRGVGLATVTHAAGVSSIDGGPLDARLPLPERSDVPAATVDAVGRTRAAGGRVVAVGTTVVRALEGRIADAGALVPGEGLTAWLAGPGVPMRAVDAVLTKIHLPGESHFELVRAFVPDEVQRAALAEASARGYRNHEFGDSALWFGRQEARIGTGV